MGRFLSLALLAVVGLGGLLLRKQLFNPWLQRRKPPIELAHISALESVIGVLMCGISVSLLFAFVTRLIDREARFSRK